LHDHQGLGAFDGVDHLVIAQRFGVVRRLAGADFRVGQPDDFLADHRQGAGDADDQYKNQMGNASQLCTRNQSFERDFFDM